MKAAARLGKVRGVALALALVPAFFMVEQVGTSGFPVAEGCSGTGAGVAPPTAKVSVVRQAGATSVNVATDGFFVLDTYGAVDLDNPAASVKVTVSTLEGDEVPGAVKRFNGENAVYLGWEADAALAVGSKLAVVSQATPTAVVSVPSPPDQVELVVVGAPAQLSASGLAFGPWFDYGHGVGEMVTCRKSGFSCASLLSLPGAEEILRSVFLTWAPPTAGGDYLLWEGRIEEQQQQLEPGSQLATQVLIQRPPSAQSMGALHFPKDTSKYCATLVVRDLRTGKELKSRQCSDPLPTTRVEHEWPLGDCDGPPTPALTEAWCKLHPESMLAECASTRPLPPVSNPPTSDQPPKQRVTPISDSDAEPRTSAACQMGPGRAGNGATALLLAATAYLGLRRRRATR